MKDNCSWFTVGESSRALERGPYAVSPRKQYACIGHGLDLATLPMPRTTLQSKPSLVQTPCFQYLHQSMSHRNRLAPPMREHEAEVTLSALFLPGICHQYYSSSSRHSVVYWFQLLAVATPGGIELYQNILHGRVFKALQQ